MFVIIITLILTPSWINTEVWKTKWDLSDMCAKIMAVIIQCWAHFQHVLEYAEPAANQHV